MELDGYVVHALCGRVNLFLLVKREHRAVAAAPFDPVDGPELVACTDGDVDIGIYLVAVVVAFLLHADGGRVGDNVYGQGVACGFIAVVLDGHDELLLADIGPTIGTCRVVSGNAGRFPVAVPGQRERLVVLVRVVREGGKREENRVVLRNGGVAGGRFEVDGRTVAVVTEAYAVCDEAVIRTCLHGEEYAGVVVVEVCLVDGEGRDAVHYRGPECLFSGCCLPGERIRHRERVVYLCRECQRIRRIDHYGGLAVHRERNRRGVHEEVHLCRVGFKAGAVLDDELEHVAPVEQPGLVLAPAVDAEVGGLNLLAVEPCLGRGDLRTEIVELEVELVVAHVQGVNLVERDDRLRGILERHRVEEQRVVGEHLAFLERCGCEPVGRGVRRCHGVHAGFQVDVVHALFVGMRVELVAERVFHRDADGAVPAGPALVLRVAPEVALDVLETGASTVPAATASAAAATQVKFPRAFPVAVLYVLCEHGVVAVGYPHVPVQDARHADVVVDYGIRSDLDNFKAFLDDVRCDEAFFGVGEDGRVASVGALRHADVVAQRSRIVLVLGAVVERLALLAVDRGVVDRL